MDEAEASASNETPGNADPPVAQQPSPPSGEEPDSNLSRGGAKGARKGPHGRRGLLKKSPPVPPSTSPPESDASSSRPPSRNSEDLADLPPGAEERTAESRRIGHGGDLAPEGVVEPLRAAVLPAPPEGEPASAITPDPSAAGAVPAEVPSSSPQSPSAPPGADPPAASSPPSQVPSAASSGRGVPPYFK